MFLGLFYKGILLKIRFTVSEMDYFLLVDSLGASQILPMRGITPLRKIHCSTDGPRFQSPHTKCSVEEVSECMVTKGQ